MQISAEEARQIKEQLADKDFTCYVYSIRPKRLKEDGTEYPYDFTVVFWEGQENRRFKFINKWTNYGWEFIEHTFKVKKKFLPDFKL